VNEEPLLITIDRGIAWLILNRPEAGNSIDLPMAQALLKASIL
jgi:2-(1,2-epoxy-1,2-dihydrophenyl)acetyl-CoA isomerase